MSEVRQRSIYIRWASDYLRRAVDLDTGQWLGEMRWHPLFGWRPPRWFRFGRWDVRLPRIPVGWWEVRAWGPTAGAHPSERGWAWTRGAAARLLQHLTEHHCGLVRE
jgi:hypothetical protein